YRIHHIIVSVLVAFLQVYRPHQGLQSIAQHRSAQTRIIVLQKHHIQTHLICYVIERSALHNLRPHLSQKSLIGARIFLEKILRYDSAEDSVPQKLQPLIILRTVLVVVVRFVVKSQFENTQIPRCKTNRVPDPARKLLVGRKKLIVQFPDHTILAFVLPENYGSIMPPKSKSVAYASSYFPTLCSVKCKVQVRINLRIICEMVDCGWYHLLSQSQNSGDSFNSPRRTQQMPGHRFCRTDVEFIGMRAKNSLDGLGFSYVAQRCRSAVHVNIINIGRHHTRIL